MIYIIADDLTGASDSGVQLTKQGLKTKVFIDPLDLTEEDIATTDVVVLDTETRDLTGDEAREVVKKHIKGVKGVKNNDNTIFYKKIDSTLRGNIGQEIEVLMDNLQKDLCILTPTFPQNKRITAGGYLLVNNEPLGNSQYYNSRLDPGEGTYIPYFIQQQTQLPVGLIELKDVMKGENEILAQIKTFYKKGIKIIIIDAVTEQDLKEIINSSQEFPGSILYCGSAGLANFLVYSGDVNTVVDKKIDIHFQPTLSVVGTRNKIMERQIKYFKNKMDVLYLKIDLEQVLNNNKKLQNDYRNQVIMGLKKGKHIILHPDPVYNREEYSTKLLTEKNITFRELEVVIRDFLSQLTVAIVRQTGLENLILTGGDTAIGVCKELGISSLIMIDELLPGIPLAAAGNKQYSNLKLITKAGGFGQVETLYKLVRNLLTYRGPRN